MSVNVVSMTVSGVVLLISTQTLEMATSSAETFSIPSFERQQRSCDGTATTSAALTSNSDGMCDARDG
ncbi:hypothetical protein OGATHE_005577 [Ogataea polymorpha]|uniref:Secreted protein n=1 Tax=Ogataea polymorpha TaxID=460523 RepID=A0A9P8NUP0_9ASCO|nr:hypothetical protein OGATHE_005577 [Ogataea polymorpha]